MSDVKDSDLTLPIVLNGVVIDERESALRATIGEICIIVPVS